jgi:hypothetical protein
VLLDFLANALLGILGTGIQVMLGEYYPRQLPGIFNHFWHIDHRANIDSTVADEYPDAFGFPHIAFFGVFLGSQGTGQHQARLRPGRRHRKLQ